MASAATVNGLIVLTTVAAAHDAETLARTLVSEGLAACVNILPEMQSVYRWKGEVTSDREHQLVIKTTGPRLDALRERLHQLHGYEVPEFLVLQPADGSPGYLEWLAANTAG